MIPDKVLFLPAMRHVFFWKSEEKIVTFGFETNYTLIHRLCIALNVASLMPTMLLFAVPVEHNYLRNPAKKLPQIL